MEYRAPQNEAEAREQIEAALVRLRQAFVDFRRVADFRPPVFILERQAPAIPQDAPISSPMASRSGSGTGSTAC